MNLIGQLIVLLVLVVGVGTGIALTAAWAREFADLLWRLVLAPRIVSMTVLCGMLLIGAATHIVLKVDVVGPLAFAIQLAAMPFLANPLSDRAAYGIAGLRKSRPEGLGWKGYVFSSKRFAQSVAYAAPRAEQ